MHCWTPSRNSTCLSTVCSHTVSRELGFHRKIFLQAQTWMKTDLFWHGYLPQAAAETAPRAGCTLPLENTQLCAFNSAQLLQPTFTVCETSSVGTAPDHMLCRRKSKHRLAGRTMVHTMQSMGSFPYIIQSYSHCKALCSSHIWEVELQMRSHGSFGVMLISCFFLWDGHLQFSWGSR